MRKLVIVSLIVLLLPASAAALTPLFMETYECDNGQEIKFSSLESQDNISLTVGKTGNPQLLKYIHVVDGYEFRNDSYILKRFTEKEIGPKSQNIDVTILFDLVNPSEVRPTLCKPWHP